MIFENGEDSTAVIAGFTIQNGYADQAGGILCVNSSPHITNCKIINNTAGYGSGVHSFGSPTISSCMIMANTSTDYGGGIFFDDYDSSNISFCSIVNNIAYTSGAGICCDRSNVNILNCTITNNSAYMSGAGIYIYDNSNMDITNCIIWGNDPDEIYVGGNNILNITYSDIQDTLWFGTGNISCNPTFCDTANTNFYLDSSSCCADAGEGGSDIGAYGIGCSFRPDCIYVAGDVNNSSSYNGLDITYGVAYFKGGNYPLYECECTPGNTWYVSGDVNGDCLYNGLDIGYGVNYLKGGSALISCPDCPPAE